MGRNNNNRRQATLWLLVWTVNNMGVTLVNKLAFSKIHFPFPYALTALHMMCSSLGCQALFYSHNYRQQQQQRQTTTSATTKEKNNNKPWVLVLLGEDELRKAAPIDTQSTRTIAAFSILFTLNIVFGNLSLRHVSVNFNQVVRSLVPVLTLWISKVWLHQTVSTQRQRAVVPVVVGVMGTCLGDPMTIRNTVGVVATFLSVVLASAKVVVSNELMTGALKLHPVVLLSVLAPAAFVQCVVLSVVSGEAAEIVRLWSTELSPAVDGKPCAILVLSSVLAFSLNISALQAYKLTSPLTCCIAAAVKQVLMIVIGTILFQTVVTPLNASGIAMVLAGSAYYSYLSVQEQVNTKPEEDEPKDTIDNSDDIGTEATNVVSSDEEEGALLLSNNPTKSISEHASERGAMTRR